MSKAHEIYGAVAQYYEQGGEWWKGYQPRTDNGRCIGEVFQQFLSQLPGIERNDLWLQANYLMQRQVGCRVVEFNDHTETTKEKVIQTCWDICMSAELE